MYCKLTARLSLFVIIFIIEFSLVFSEAKLEELYPGFNYAEWFKNETGYTPNNQWFGAWVIAPRNDELYIGFATARPAEYDGTLLARWVGEWLLPVGQFSEQGIHCIKWIEDTLYGIGSDPSITDGWDGGNFYRYYPKLGIFEKIRYNTLKKPVLPNVLHSWGFYYDSTKKKFYMSTGSYYPSQYTKNGNDCGSQFDSTLACFGEVWQSYDYGSNWNLNSGGKDNNISSNRVYDIIKFNSVLFITEAELNNTYYLKKSSDEGVSWDVIESLNPSPLFRMCVFNNKLVIAANIARTIYVIDENNNIKTLTMPGALNYSFNVFANVDDKYFITYFSDGSVFSTYDLEKWTELIPSTGRNFVSIAYWDYEKSIVLSERGDTGSIWKYDLTDLLNTGVNKNSETDINYNITNNSISINLNNDKIKNIEITDILGNSIIIRNGINSKNCNIDISELNSGIYFVIIRCGKNYFVKKLLKC
ncbi:MAG: T9SS type A sorting domain-containing protein [Ignavibacteriae bacterium]|nr:T9SS type A sorting domain-containing protein [Ignavibacteriota bacterium]